MCSYVVIRVIAVVCTPNQQGEKCAAVSCANQPPRRSSSRIVEERPWERHGRQSEVSAECLRWIMSIQLEVVLGQRDLFIIKSALVFTFTAENSFVCTVG
ncbi:hypothetical protein FQN60_009341 [Etheostoma spectabile]|uniref:Uncharacterized protein n=1 Tax=Etheostoma spectabile TaxID=54343 RepID=A0A5J5DIR6_9PERO|nr:hypothetical protein FQN60_009341 [Etheostoma spectabile]